MTSFAGEKGALAERKIRFPAEFEPQEAVWLGWPRYANKRDMPTEPVLLEIIEALAGVVRVELLVHDAPEAVLVRESLESKGVDPSRVRLHELPHADIWLRDTGPQFVQTDDGLRVVGFAFNCWGYEAVDSEASLVDGAIARRVADRLGLPFVSSPVVAEGGNHEHNGRGTMLASRSVAEARNPDLALAAITDELRALYGVDNIVWLEEGIPEDDLSFAGPLPGDLYTAIGTGGHVDEFARFCDPNTVLLAEVDEDEARRDPIAEMARERLEVNYRILAQSVDSDGRPLRVLRVPVPASIVAEMRPGDGVYESLSRLDYATSSFPTGRPVQVIAATSYLNFLVSNGLVLMPTYGSFGRSREHRDRDEKARAILREAFPDRRIVGIDPVALNLGGGGIHCVSHQQPTSDSWKR